LYSRGNYVTITLMQEDKDNQQPANQAGSVILPGGAVQPAQPPAPVPATQPTKQNTAPAPTPISPQPEQPIIDSNEEVAAEYDELDDPEQINEDGESYAQDGDQLQEDDNPVATHQEIAWLGSEYIHHEKSGSWFMALVAVSVLSAGLAFLITRDLITSGMILFCGFIFGIFSRRTPQQIQYSVSDNGVTIGEKTYNFKQFKSFAVAKEGAIENIVLQPLKRFDTLRTIYCAPEQLDDIVEIISAHIPMDDHSPDVVDKLMHKVRF